MLRQSSYEVDDLYQRKFLSVHWSIIMRDSLWLQVQMTFQLQKMQQHMFDKMRVTSITTICFIGNKLDNLIISNLIKHKKVIFSLNQFTMYEVSYVIGKCYLWIAMIIILIGQSRKCQNKSIFDFYANISCNSHSTLESILRNNCSVKNFII